MAKINSCYMVK